MTSGRVMFFLSKWAETWTLRYEASALGRISAATAILGGAGLAIFESVKEHPHSVSLLGIALLIVFCVALLGHWFLYDSATTAVFDFRNKTLSVDCERPWFGPRRTFDFAEVATIQAIKQLDEGSVSWEAQIELRDGSSIRLGQEGAGKNERIRVYVEEIGAALRAAG